jgi:murein DD-endopeptidase MepM/ murein hydrolase activator NlpD
MAQPLIDPTLPEDALMQREYSQLDSKLTGLHQNSLYVEQMLQDLYELLADKRAFLAALPTLKPVVGYFTSGFGVRHSPLGDGRVKMHEGVDIANHLGTQVHAPADGIVIFAGVKAGYGNTLIIDHGYGLETWYGHTKQLLVSKGQRVKKGDAIALLGSTGRSTGPHLHYEVRVNGTPVDPLSYILEDT